VRVRVRVVVCVCVCVRACVKVLVGVETTTSEAAAAAVVVEQENVVVVVGGGVVVVCGDARTCKSRERRGAQCVRGDRGTPGPESTSP
jgi:hypothetical protein